MAVDELYQLYALLKVVADFSRPRRRLYLKPGLPRLASVSQILLWPWLGVVGLILSTWIVPSSSRGLVLGFVPVVWTCFCGLDRCLGLYISALLPTLSLVALVLVSVLSSNLDPGFAASIGGQRTWLYGGQRTWL